MLPKRRPTKGRMGTRKDDGPLRCPAHLQWVRGHECCAAWRGDMCEGASQAAHVRYETDGSLSKKPGDDWTISLCHYHHRVQHNIGERAFENRYGINMKALAQEFAAKSPALKRRRMKEDRNAK